MGNRVMSALKEKQRPLRTCLVCGEKRAKDILLRFAESSGTIVLDEKKSLGGRGCYCCSSQECVSRLRKKQKKMNKALHREGLVLGEEVLSSINCFMALLRGNIVRKEVSGVKNGKNPGI